LLRARGERTKAEAEFRTALKEQQRLADGHLDKPDYRRDLAGSHNNLGNLLRDLGRQAEAGEEYRAALKESQRLADEYPAVPAYRKELALSHNNLGVLLKNLGELAKAQDEYLSGLKEYQLLAKDHPAEPDYRQGIARSHGNLGNVLAVLDKPAEAETEFRAALEEFQRLAKDHPAVPDYRNELAGNFINLALFLRNRKDLPQARRLLDEAMPHHQAALQANPNNAGYRRYYYINLSLLTPVLLDLGDHAEAAEAAERFSKAALNPANDLYTAACYLARCVPLAEKDDMQSEAKRKEQAQSYGDRAMALLHQAVKNGYKDVARLKVDKDLDPLRQRKDFQQLLRELEEKKP
jgi:tetratricopeptide (TPR) repeat protein